MIWVVVVVLVGAAFLAGIGVGAALEKEKNWGRMDDE